MNNNRFSFWTPIVKSEMIDRNGEKQMVIGGIASTPDRDADGEYLDPKGFDVKPLMDSGFINWNHQSSKDPSTIIGEPTKAEISNKGFYIEAKLYNNSKTAKDVYDLFETLSKSDSSRKLGFSIEGKVLERKSNDKSSKDYNYVTKAQITGVAVTHCPKNPKTFADLIKGGFDIEPEYFSKAEIIEKLVSDFPETKADVIEKIYKKLIKSNIMDKDIKFTQEDVDKAYEALDLIKGENVEKKQSLWEKLFGKSNSEKTEDSIEKSVETKTPPTTVEGTQKKVAKGDEESGEDDVEDAEEKFEKKEKGLSADELNQIEFEAIEKALQSNHELTSTKINAIGTIMKDFIDTIKGENEKFKTLLKAQEDEINSLHETIEKYGSTVNTQKSVANAVEKSFASDEDIKKGNEISISANPKLVAEILDQATFSKGFDNEFSQAVTAFEASKTVTPNIIARLKNEMGIQLTK